MKWRGRIRNRSGAPAKDAVDHTARKIGYASLLISALAVLVPFAQQEFFRREGNAERVVIAASHTDLYGNPVEYQEFKSGGFLIERTSNPKLPVFAVRLKTGGGSEFLQSMSSDHP